MTLIASQGQCRDRLHLITHHRRPIVDRLHLVTHHRRRIVGLLHLTTRLRVGDRIIGGKAPTMASLLST